MWIIKYGIKVCYWVNSHQLWNLRSHKRKECITTHVITLELVQIKYKWRVLSPPCTQIIPFVHIHTCLFTSEAIQHLEGWRFWLPAQKIRFAMSIRLWKVNDSQWGSLCGTVTKWHFNLRGQLWSNHEYSWSRDYASMRHFFWSFSHFFVITYFHISTIIHFKYKNLTSHSGYEA